MKLYLVQHGEAASKDVDPERQLTDKGKEDVSRVAAFLGKAGVRADGVIHSGKLRAQQTAEILAGAIAPGVEIGINGQINPNDDPTAIEWQELIGGESLLVVGHLPFMGRLVAYLVTGQPHALVTAWQPGSMVFLELDEDNWQIKWMLRPELLS